MHTGEKSDSAALHRSLESVIHHNSGMWFRFVLGILRNEADAEDVIQEAVRRVLACNRSFPSEDQVKMYLGRAIGNTAFEIYNNRKRDRLRHTPVRESIPLYSKTSSPDIRMEEKEEAYRKKRMLGLIEEGLKQLPSKQEEALRMTILESDGHSIRRIGAIHKIPYSTLRHRNKQGLKRMRIFLERALEE